MYSYEAEKKKIFTEKGQVLFIGIRDNVKAMIKTSGAVTMGHAMSLPSGAADSWEMMACIDRMVELKELREIKTSGAGQDRIFVSA